MGVKVSNADKRKAIDHLKRVQGKTEHEAISLWLSFSQKDQRKYILKFIH